MTTETWIPVDGAAPGYFVSDLGRVRSPRGRILAPQSNGRYGYLFIKLGRGRSHYVHRLVAAAFIGDVTGLDVEHSDGDTSNNRVTNLQIVTHAENMRLQRLRKPRCKRGHEFAIHGKWSPRGRRYCGACQALREKRRVRSRARVA